MSRFEIHHAGKSLAFGKDHACGEYLQIWVTTKYKEPDSENTIVDEDRFTGFTRKKMLRLIKLHGFELNELESASIRKTKKDDWALWSDLQNICDKI